MNGFGTFGDSSASRMSYTNPVVLKALLVSLVADAGVRPQDITVYDASRMFPQEMVTLCTQTGCNTENSVRPERFLRHLNSSAWWQGQQS